MRKLIIIALVSLFFTSVGVVSAASVEYNEIKTFFEEYSHVEETWSEGKLKRGDDIYGPNSEKIGYMYRIFNKNVQQGYILYLDELGIVEAVFEGKDLASDITGKVYYILPGRFLSKIDYYDIVDKSIYEQIDLYHEVDYNDYNNPPGESSGWASTGDPYFPEDVTFTNEWFTINTSSVPNVSENLDGESTSFSSKSYLNNVPDYHNWSVGPIYGGCGPTAAAMMIAYYDNEEYDYLTDIDGTQYGQDFPLTHTQVNNTVDDLIIEMSDYLGNCRDADGNNTIPHNQCQGVGPGPFSAGMTNYLDAGYWDDYDVVIGRFDVGYTDYKNLINLGNPAVIYIENHPFYSAGDGAHYVLGTGYYTAMQSLPGAIVYDDWSTTPKEIFLSFNVLKYYYFLYEF